MSTRRRPQQTQPLSEDDRQEIVLSFVAERESDYARLARFLHDHVGQVLSAVGLQLDALRHEFGANMPELDQRTAGIQQMLETIIGHIRDLSYELNPSVVQRTGLQYALERLAARFATVFSGSVRIQLDPAVRVPAERAEALYRGAEAAMELVKSTADCTQVDLHLKRNRVGFVLEIRANARISPEAQSSFPALRMNYYAARNDITVSVNRSGENDTIVRFTCPAA